MIKTAQYYDTSQANMCIIDEMIEHISKNHHLYDPSTWGRPGGPCNLGERAIRSGNDPRWRLPDDGYIWSIEGVAAFQMGIGGDVAWWLFAAPYPWPVEWCGGHGVDTPEAAVQILMHIRNGTLPYVQPPGEKEPAEPTKPTEPCKTHECRWDFVPF